MTIERQEPELRQANDAKQSSAAGLSDTGSHSVVRDSGKTVLMGVVILFGLVAVAGGWFAWSKHTENNQQRVAVQERLQALSDQVSQLEREKSLIQTSIQAMELRNTEQQTDFTQQLAAKDAEIQTVADRYEALQQQEAAAVADAESLQEQAQQQKSDLEQMVEQLQLLIEDSQPR
jgi:chromosome segregation ATPase